MAEVVELKAFVTASPNEADFSSVATKREWEAYPKVKGYVTAQSDESSYIDGETMRVVGIDLQPITQIYTFEPLTGSIDIDTTYQIEVKAKDKPKPPNIQEPIYVTGKYGIEMNPYFTPGDIGRTLYLNDKWDIFSDASGQIALVSGAYAIAQNAANAVRLFKNDAYLAQTRGIPHFEIELGKAPAIAAPILRTRIRETVLNVNGVTGAEVDLTFDESGRVMGGEVQATVLESENVQIDF
jgi:hypothetical protein